MLSQRRCDKGVDSGGDAKSVSDKGADSGPNYDFSCQASPWPKTAPATVLWAGKVHEWGTTAFVDVAGATIEIRSIADDSILASTTSDSTGAFVFSLPTAGQALAVYARLEATGYVTTYYYPPYALWKDEPSRSLWLLPVAYRDTAAKQVGVQVDPTAALVAVRVNDCGTPPLQVEGAMVSFTPAAQVTAQVNGNNTLQPGNTVLSWGYVLGFNVPAGPLDVAITYGNETWRPWKAKSFSDAFVYTPRRP